jgi:SAM-dependent methyltransferase
MSSGASSSGAAAEEERRRSFDRVARAYAAARPGYPAALLDVIAATVAPPADVLEIGPGPATLTVDLARRGYRVLAVELGRNLAQVARERLAPWPGQRVVVADFHAWRPQPETVDLVVSGTAFHWIDPAVGLPKAWHALRPGGWLALAWNHPARGRGVAARLWDASDAVYLEVAPELVRPTSTSGPLAGARRRYAADWRREIRASGLFHPAQRRTWRWRQELDATAYLALLDTYSDHASLSSARRRVLYARLRRLIDQDFGGRVARAYASVLYLAKARPDRAG